MVNHGRTLLLNIDGIFQFPADFPGEEYVDPAYRAVRLSRALTGVRNCLFGPDPDRAMLNYRLRQYTNLWHSTELARHITALDPRVTYWPPGDAGLFTGAIFGATATKLAGTADAALYVQGGPRLSAIGKLLNKWLITVEGTTIVSVERLTEPTETFNYGYTMDGGISSLVPLTGTPLGFLFRGSVGAQWVVQVLARPYYGIPEIVAALDVSMADGAGEALFGVVPVEPYRTFAKLWEQQTFPYRLAGLTAALAYRTESIRLGV